MGFTLLVSTPEDHLGSFFERLPSFGWPTVHSTWCNRDLKVRPQRKRLVREFGEGQFYKLVGVRKYESTRRKKMHKAGRFFATDYQTGKDTLVYPLLKWTSSDVRNYLKAQGLPVSALYKRFGVSGCFWCPFYQVKIYKRILRALPDLYDEFIEWEIKLGAPSVIGQVYLRDLKKEVGACSR
jgi:3'-phosphoadenosine 5'-phosphosulfate sulfotransferase (PAPS reductase)/FAD synthetase